MHKQNISQKNHLGSNISSSYCIQSIWCTPPMISCTDNDAMMMHENSQISGYVLLVDRWPGQANRDHHIISAEQMSSCLLVTSSKYSYWIFFRLLEELLQIIGLTGLVLAAWQKQAMADQWIIGSMDWQICMLVLDPQQWIGGVLYSWWIGKLDAQNGGALFISWNSTIIASSKWEGNTFYSPVMSIEKFI